MLYFRLLGVTCKHCRAPYLCNNKGSEKQNFRFRLMFFIMYKSKFRKMSPVFSQKWIIVKYFLQLEVHKKDNVCYLYVQRA